MEYILTRHAQERREARGITTEWIESAVSAPDATYIDEEGNSHYIKRIIDFDGRNLHVIMNINVDPNRVITVFFDRSIK